MINLQNPEIPIPELAIEIDALVYDLQLKLDSNIDWLTNSYGRAYRHFQYEKGKMVFYPEIYNGNKTGKFDYFQPRPDNDKKGSCYFLVGNENQSDYQQFDFNFLNHNLDIVFIVNLKLINEELLNNEIFTQHLIRDVRNVITKKTFGTFYNITIESVTQNFNEVFKEFSFSERENYMKAPMQAFRFNCKVSYQEDCINKPIDRCSIVNQNISPQEILCGLNKLDFSDPNVFNTLTPQQITDIENNLKPK